MPTKAPDSQRRDRLLLESEFARDHSDEPRRVDMDAVWGTVADDQSDWSASDCMAAHLGQDKGQISEVHDEKLVVFLAP